MHVNLFWYLHIFRLYLKICCKHINVRLKQFLKKVWTKFAIDDVEKTKDLLLKHKIWRFENTTSLYEWVGW